MTISGNYPTPVIVNGYSCDNCAQVAEAKKGIDPAHPKSGPYGIDAKDDPTAHSSAAVTFGGSLSGSNADAATSDTQTAAPSSTQTPTTPSGPGAQVNLVV